MFSVRVLISINFFLNGLYRNPPLNSLMILIKFLLLKKKLSKTLETILHYLQLTS